MAPKKSKGKTVSLSEFVGAKTVDNCDWAEDAWEEEQDLQGRGEETAEEQKAKYLRQLQSQRYNHESTKLGQGPGFRDTERLSDENWTGPVTGPFYAHLSNVNTTATEEDIRNHFTNLKITQVLFEETKKEELNADGKMVMKTRRFGLLEFETAKDLNFALNRDQHTFMGLKLKVTRADPDRAEKMIRSRDRKSVPGAGGAGGMRTSASSHSLSGFGRESMGAEVAVAQPVFAERPSRANREDVGNFRSGPAAQPNNLAQLSDWRNEEPVSQPAMSPVSDGDRFPRNGSQQQLDRPRKDPRKDRAAAPPANNAESLERWGSLR